jgi:hypothetical protein
MACSIPLLAKQQAGTYQGQRSSGAPLAQLRPAAALVASKDFNGNGKPDYLLYNAATRQTAIWYLNNNVFVNGVFGPTLPAGWSLAAP